MLRKKMPGLPWLSLVLITAFLDQLTKVLVSESLSFAQVKPLLPGLNLTLSYNPGIAFGWLNDGQGTVDLYLLLLTGLLTLALMIWLLKTPRGFLTQGLGLALIVGGAIGNLVDRILHGHVIDFIDFYVGQWHWHTFNLADSFICVGAVFLIASAFLIPPKENP